jgi:hypothetical protein
MHNDSKDARSVAKEFCDKYDQNSFDPDFKNMPLDEFVPMLKRLFSQPKQSIYLKAMPELG